MSRSYRNSDPRPPIMQGSPPPPEWRAPRDAWDRPPWNRWSFQNVRQILPTAEVARGANPTAWDSAPRVLTGLTFERHGGGRMSVADMLDDYTDGFLVAHHGQIVHESYHNGMTRDTLHLSQSVSKSVVATTAGILIGQGHLSADQQVTSYLPELAATGWHGATLQQVLDMTTGVKFIEEYEDPNSDIGRTDVAGGWRPLPPGADPSEWPATLWDQILGLTKYDAAHGARFKYRSVETDLLGIMIERVTGETLAKAVSRLLWSPMGAERPAEFTVDAAGTALADGGMSACLRDYARFGQTMLDDGMAGGQQVIPRAWVEDVRHGKHGRFDDQSREFMPDGRYRNMFWIEDKARPAHLCLGVFGQFIYVDPDAGLLVVKLSSWPDFIDDVLHSNTMRAIKAIAAALG
jgi:CubicO group peptidase (beta-lactamase class C family)